MLALILFDCISARAQNPAVAGAAGRAYSVNVIQSSQTGQSFILESNGADHPTVGRIVMLRRNGAPTAAVRVLKTYEGGNRFAAKQIKSYGGTPVTRGDTFDAQESGATGKAATPLAEPRAEAPPPASAPPAAAPMVAASLAASSPDVAPAPPPSTNTTAAAAPPPNADSGVAFTPLPDPGDPNAAAAPAPAPVDPAQTPPGGPTDLAANAAVVATNDPPPPPGSPQGVDGPTPLPPPPEGSTPTAPLDGGASPPGGSPGDIDPNGNPPPSDTDALSGEKSVNDAAVNPGGDAAPAAGSPYNPSPAPGSAGNGTGEPPSGSGPVEDDEDEEEEDSLSVEEVNPLDPRRQWLTISFGYFRNAGVNGASSSYFAGGGARYGITLLKRVLPDNNSVQDSVVIEAGAFYYRVVNLVDIGDSFTILPLIGSLRYNLQIGERWGFFIYGSFLSNQVVQASGKDEVKQGLALESPGGGIGFNIQVGPNWDLRVDAGTDVVQLGLMLRF